MEDIIFHFQLFDSTLYSIYVFFMLCLLVLMPMYSITKANFHYFCCCCSCICCCLFDFLSAFMYCDMLLMYAILIELFDIIYRLSVEAVVFCCRIEVTYMGRKSTDIYYRIHINNLPLIAFALFRMKLAS